MFIRRDINCKKVRFHGQISVISNQKLIGQLAREYIDSISAERLDFLNEFPGYDTKSDDEAPVMLELWAMQSTPLLPSLPGPLWH